MTYSFALSYRDVEEMMAERGVTVSYESVREWCLKFGGMYTKRIRSRRGRLGDRWHLDEVFLRINGKLQYLWRAVDQDGEVLDILVQSRRNKKVAKKFFRKLLPLVTKSAATGTNPFGVRPTKLQTPLTDALIADCDAALRHHFFDVSVAERKSKIKPSAMTDNYGRKAVAAIG